MEEPLTKLKTITLAAGYRCPGEGPNDPLGYRVVRLSNSTEFSPGDLIKKTQADELCDAKNWQVSIVSAT